jgi:Protein of unknown function (DUF3108)
MLTMVSRKGPGAAEVGKRFQRSLRCAAAAALVVGLAQAAGLAAPPATAPLSLSYTVSIRGFPLLVLDFRIAETVGTYSVSGVIRTSGVVDMVADFVMRSDSRGTIAADGLRPSLHETSSHWRNGQRGTHLEYATDGTVSAVVTPAETPGRPEPPLPTPQQTVGTLDPLSAIVAINREIIRTNSCAMRLPVFDGRRRYDLVLADDGVEQAAATADPTPLRRCSIEVMKIAGFPEKDAHADHGRAWILAAGEGQRALPVRIEFDTKWGPITVRMAQTAPER